MYPAHVTRRQIDRLLARARQSGVRVTVLKMSALEAWGMRAEITQSATVGRSYDGIPIKIVGADRWT